MVGDDRLLQKAARLVQSPKRHRAVGGGWGWMRWWVVRSERLGVSDEEWRPVQWMVIVGRWEGGDGG